MQGGSGVLSITGERCRIITGIIKHGDLIGDLLNGLKLSNQKQEGVRRREYDYL